jgi:hypothetical protein
VAYFVPPRKYRNGEPYRASDRTSPSTDAERTTPTSQGELEMPSYEAVLAVALIVLTISTGGYGLLIFRRQRRRRHQWLERRVFGSR